MNTYKASGSRSRRLLLTSMAAIGLLLGGVGIASATTSPSPSPSPIPTQAPVVTSLVPAPAVTEAPETKGDHCWNDKADANEATDKAEANDESDANEANDKADANEATDKADANEATDKAEANDKSDANQAKCDAVAPSTTIG